MHDMSRELLTSRLSAGSSSQVDLLGFMRKRRDLIVKGPRPKVLDLGCGNGRSFEAIRSVFPDVAYHGLDIELSPEVSTRTRGEIPFQSFNGVKIPFADDYFDAIHSHQVLEHVRHPDALVVEAGRVLAPGGFFLGSVSQLEPYHSHSIFNWTASGVVQVFGSHGMEIVELAPRIDGVALTLRRLFGFDKFNEFFAHEGFFSHYIEEHDREYTAWEQNCLKLVCADHIVFLARKT